MCPSYKRDCECGQNTAEIFFGNMLLDEASVVAVYCPNCSQADMAGDASRVWDNGWVLELDMHLLQSHASTFGIDRKSVTANWVFDAGYATWVGIIPDETARRNRERDELQHLAKTDIRAYIEAMRSWGIAREKRFIKEGWRKMKPHAARAI